VDAHQGRAPLISNVGPQGRRMLSLKIPVLFQTIALLTLSNVFMTFAWYAHLKELNTKPWLLAAIASWGIALLEYLFQVPANRIGFTQYSVGQLKIIQEVITLSVFAPFAVFYLRQPLRLDYLWAALCMLGAVYFMFRGNLVAK
jgi:uncharacterized protein (DUF486 family)